MLKVDRNENVLENIDKTIQYIIDTVKEVGEDNFDEHMLAVLHYTAFQLKAIKGLTEDGTMSEDECKLAYRVITTTMQTYQDFIFND